MLSKIRGRFILNKIFIFLARKKSLKVIKYNKPLQLRLNVTIKDYQNCVYLKKLTKKYNYNSETLQEMRDDFNYNMNGMNNNINTMNNNIRSGANNNNWNNMNQRTNNNMNQRKSPF